MYCEYFSEGIGFNTILGGLSLSKNTHILFNRDKKENIYFSELVRIQLWH